MKFDHFSACKHLPPAVKKDFIRLKELFKVRNGTSNNSKNKHQQPHHRINSSKTAEYYQESALKFGMRDTKDGIFIVPQHSEINPSKFQLLLSSSFPRLQGPPTLQFVPPLPKSHSPSAYQGTSKFVPPPPKYNSFQANNCGTRANLKNVHKYSAPKRSLPHAALSPSSSCAIDTTPMYCEVTKPQKDVRRLLATDQDELYLNPLHCFVRRNVEVFMANGQDVAAPSMGRKKSILIGQVGIRCIHCVKLPYKDRVKRAVCYPPTIANIYHSVSNMKFDHFGACRGLPPQQRAEFQALKQSSLGRKNNKSNKNKNDRKQNQLNPTNTSQFYTTSARDIGLIDSEMGIKFLSGIPQPHAAMRGPSLPMISYPTNPPSPTIGNDNKQDGMSILVKAATESQGPQHTHHCPRVNISHIHAKGTMQPSISSRNAYVHT